MIVTTTAGDRITITRRKSGKDQTGQIVIATQFTQIKIQFCCRVALFNHARDFIQLVYRRLRRRNTNKQFACVL